MTEEVLGEQIAQLEVSVTADTEFNPEIDEKRILECKRYNWKFE